MKDKTKENTKPRDVESDKVENIITLTKHFSPDFGETYYFIRLAHINLYSSADLDKAQERFDHIIKIGLKSYLEEIRIKVTLIKEQAVEK